jgi:hypothetical protein
VEGCPPLGRCRSIREEEETGEAVTGMDRGVGSSSFGRRWMFGTLRKGKGLLR